MKLCTVGEEERREDVNYYDVLVLISNRLIIIIFQGAEEGDRPALLFLAVPLIDQGQDYYISPDPGDLTIPPDLS